MLGEKIGEESGQVIGTRVLPGDAGGIEMEASFQAQGRILGVDGVDTGTYVSRMRPDGTIYGEGQGLLVTADGDFATWKGSGVGHPTGEGMAIQFRGALYYETSSEALDRLNHIVGIYEYDVDADGKTHAVLWEWS